MSRAMAESKEELKKYTWEEVKEHRNSDSLWIVVDGKVYDVTEFMEEHPGGEEILMEHGGKNATEAFDDVGHSPDAKEIQKKYLIGVVVGDKKKDTSSKSSQPVSSDTTGGGGGGGDTNWPTMSLVVLFLVLLVAYVYRNYAHLFGSNPKEQ